MSLTPLGTSPIGGDLIGLAGVAPEALVIGIEGEAITGSYRPGSLDMSDALNERNTCSFDLKYDAGFSPELGQDIEIIYLGELLFRGTIDEIGTQDTPSAGTAFHSIRGVDYNQLADRFVVAKNYEVAGQTLRDIVVDLVLNQAEGWLAIEGVTTDYVEEGPPIQVAKFNYRTMRECFDDLANATGYLWMIDPWKRLIFFDRTRYGAPFKLGIGGIYNYKAMLSRRERRNYRNRQFLRAGFQKTDPKFEKFAGNGKDTTFTLKLPVAGAPTVQKNSVAQTVGVRGKDDDEAFQWYYQEKDKQISQRSGDTVLTSSDELRVDYIGLFPIIIDAENDREIAARKAVEGGTGIYSDVETDEEIDDLTLANEKVDELIRRFGTLHTTIEVDTPVWGLRAGQLLDVAHPDLTTANGKFLVSRVGIRDRGDYRLRASIEATSGELDGGWVGFFKRLIASGKKVAIRENEQLVLSRKRIEQVTLTDSLVNSSSIGDLKGPLDDPYTSARFGVTAGLPSCCIGFAKFGPHPRDT